MQARVWNRFRKRSAGEGSGLRGGLRFAVLLLTLMALPAAAQLAPLVTTNPTLGPATPAVQNAAASSASGHGAVDDVLVLVPGYLGQAGSFLQAGVLPPLLASGWVDGGGVLPSYHGIGFTHSPIGTPRRGAAGALPSRVVYAVVLPTDAPVVQQSQWLDAMLRAVALRHPEANLHLAGHSAGGVVARFTIVRGEHPNVATLITVATPNGGSDMAEFGRMIGESPFGMFAPFFGLPDVGRSRDLLRDLGRPTPDNLLGWLNEQPHPDIRYVSVVRASDSVVAPWQQDLDRVAVLHGRVETLVSPSGHALTPDDGVLLAALLRGVLPPSTVPRRR